MTKTLDKYDYVEKRLTKMGCTAIEVGCAISDENLEQSYQLLKANQDLSRQKFLSVVGIEEDTFDLSDHKLRLYKYTYCRECGQLVDKTDYAERKYCRYCQNPSDQTFDEIEKIYEKAKYVMNCLLSIGLADEKIKTAIADKNLDKSYTILKNNQDISAEQFVIEFNGND